MDLASLLNAPTEITHDGVAYQLREPTLLERGMFQRWMEQRAREAAGRATDLPPEEQRQLLRDITADIAVGTFAWGGAAWAMAVQTPEGIAKIFSLVLGVTPELAEKIVAHQTAERVAILVGTMTGGTDEEKKGLRQMLVSLGLSADFLNAYSSSNSPTHPSTTPWLTSDPSLQLS